MLAVLFLLFASATMVADQSRLITLDVAVTDKNGHLVAGLEQRLGLFRRYAVDSAREASDTTLAHSVSCGSRIS